MSSRLYETIITNLLCSKAVPNFSKTYRSWYPMCHQLVAGRYPGKSKDGRAKGKQKGQRRKSAWSWATHADVSLVGTFAGGTLRLPSTTYIKGKKKWERKVLGPIGRGGSMGKVFFGALFIEICTVPHVSKTNVRQCGRVGIILRRPHPI